MKKQPDFRLFFYDCFRAKPKKTAYSIRPDSNWYHDLIFLKSWIHDVIIQRESLEILTIILEGDGWGLYMKASDDDFKMKIQDTEIPYLPSQRNRAE